MLVDRAHPPEAATVALEPAEGRGGTIVCGVEDTPAALAAVAAASELSACLGLRLVLVAVGDGVVDWRGETVDSLVTQQAREGARRLLQRVAKEPWVVPAVECRHEVGDPATSLVRLAEEEGADLLLIGSSQRRFLRRRSRLAEELAVSSPCPVLVVPPPPG